MSVITNYRCPVCEKMIPVDKSQIKAGDKVSVTIQTETETRNSIKIRYSQKKATVLAADKDEVSIEYRGKLFVVPKANVTPADVPSALTYAFIGTCECGGGE